MGRRATIGFWVGWMLVTCALVVRKLLVAPESKNGPFVDGVHVYVDCAKECGSGQGI